MSEEGIVLSTVKIRTKKGDDYEINSFMTKEDFIKNANASLMNKENFVLDFIEPDGTKRKVLLVSDVIYSIDATDFKPQKLKLK